MSLPGFNAIASLFRSAQSYQAKSSATVLTTPDASISPSMTAQAAGRAARLTLGVSYPPPDGLCQICDCTCYPFPC